MRTALALLSLLNLTCPQRLEPATSDQPYGVVIIVARVHGFDLTHIKQKAGKVLVCVYNRSGSKQLIIRLDQDKGSRILEETLNRSMVDFRRFIDLSAGKYVLTEVGHPGWTARIDLE